MDTIITLPATTIHIGTQLSRQLALTMNMSMLLKILSSMTCQGLPFHGQNDDSDSNLEASRKGTFDWLQRKTNEYTSHEIQKRLMGSWCSKKAC